MKILLACADVPLPSLEASTARLFYLSKALATVHDLDLACVRDTGRAELAHFNIFRHIDLIGQTAARLTSTGEVRHRPGAVVDGAGRSTASYATLGGDIRSLLEQRSYDALWITSDLARGLASGAGIPMLVEVCDRSARELPRRLRLTNGTTFGPLRLPGRWVVHRDELHMYAGADACVFRSDVDAADFRSLVPGCRTEVIENGVNGDCFSSPSPPQEAAPLIVFAAALNDAENIDAAVFLCRDLMPRIRARRPGVRVVLVGKGPTPEVRGLESDNVDVREHAGDLPQDLATATVVVYPTRKGGSSRDHILQAWAMGKAVVGTPISLRGLDYTDGVNVRVGVDSAGLVEAMLELLNDPERRANLGNNARATVLREYGWEAKARQLDAILRAITLPYTVRGQDAGIFLTRSRGGGPPRVLMLALQFPPHSQSTGRLRSVGFVRHLPAFGWLPVVVTARESAFSDGDPKTLAEIPSGARIIRAFGVDIARAIAVKGKYPRWIATPDRWNTWAVGSAIAAVEAVKLQRVDAIWATFPVPSALFAALVLQRWTGLPMVVDLRDPIVYETWPESRWDRRVYSWLERRVVHAASAVVLTTPRAVDMYRQRYRNLPPDRFCEIANGVDELVEYSCKKGVAQVVDDNGITLLHSGLMEVPDRDPRAFFAALRLLLDRRALPQRPLKIVLRASGRDGEFRAAADALGVGKLLALEPRLSHEEAVAEFQTASALLLFQGSACNRQIPAKAYEYLASRRPIIGLLDPQGDTHALVSGKWGIPYCADMSDSEAIAAMLQRFFADLDKGTVNIPSASLAQSYSRRSQAGQLARLLDTICKFGGAARSGVVSGSSSSVATG